MTARMTDLHDKEVICLADGTRLGFVDDVEIDTCTAQLTALVIHGKSKLLGILGREPDIVIRWEDIEVIGDETVLVNYCSPNGGSCRTKGPDILGGLFR